MRLVSLLAQDWQATRARAALRAYAAAQRRHRGRLHHRRDRAAGVRSRGLRRRASSGTRQSPTARRKSAGRGSASIPRMAARIGACATGSQSPTRVSATAGRHLSGMCGIAGIVRLSRLRATGRSGGARRRTRRDEAGAGPTASGSVDLADGKVGLAHIAASRSSISATRGRSPWPPPTDACTSRSTARSTTTANFGASSNEGRGLPLAIGHGGAAAALRRARRRDGARAAGHVRFRDLGRSRPELLFLARDPFGIKPLYYADDGKQFRFASQVKALLKGGRVDDRAGTRGLRGLPRVGPHPGALHALSRNPLGAFGIASCTCAAAAKAESRATSTYPRNSARPSNPARSAWRRRPRSSAKRFRRACATTSWPMSPSGSSCRPAWTRRPSAGSAVQHGGSLHALTVGFPEFRDTPDDEVPIAAAVAAKFGIRHEAHWITREDFESELANLIEAMDQPSIDGVNTYFVSREASRAGMKVALSGLGGDELFGGYPSFWQVPRLARSLAFTRMLPFAGTIVPQGHAAGRSPRSPRRNTRAYSNTAARIRAPTCCGARCSCRGRSARRSTRRRSR